MSGLRVDMWVSSSKAASDLLLALLVWGERGMRSMDDKASLNICIRDCYVWFRS